MNRSRSPLRPLSNISNKKLTDIMPQTKDVNQKFSYTQTVQSVLVSKRPTIQSYIEEEQKPHQSAKSSITSYQSDERNSILSDTSRKSVVIKRMSRIQNEESKFIMFKIIVILGIIASLLFTYQILFATNQLQEQQYFSEIKKEVMLIDSISKSIIEQVKLNQRINVEIERQDVQNFYQDEYNLGLWRQIENKVNADPNIKKETQENQQFWIMQ